MSLVEIARLKQASRDEDDRALASGQKSREQLRRENSIFAPLGPMRFRIRDAKPLR